MGNNYKTTDIIPPGRQLGGAIPTTDILPNAEEPKRHLGGFAPTRTMFPRDDERTKIEAKYKVVLSDHKGFEEVILEEASTRKEAYDAYRAWITEFNALTPSQSKAYPPNTWAICTRNGELSWKTKPFTGSM